MRTSFRLFGALFLACCLTSLARGEAGIQWQTDLEAAKRLAASSNRLVLIHFSATWCHWCKPLESQVFNKDSVAQAIEPNFVAVKLDLDQHRNLARQYGVTGVPWDVIITPDGQVVKDFNSPQGSSAYVAAMTEIAAKYRPQTPGMVASIGAATQATAIPTGYGAPAASPPANSAPPSATANYPPPQASPPQPQRQSQPQQQNRGDNRYADYYNRQQPVADRVAPPLANQAGAGPQFGSTAPPQSGPNFGAPANGTQPPAAYQPPSLAPQGGIPQVSMTPPNASYGGQPGLSNTPAAGVNAPPYGAAPQQNHQAPPPAYPSQSGASGFAAPGNHAPPAANASAYGLEGYCPVHLMEQGGWIKGDPAYGAIHRGKTYLFGSQQCQQRFMANPDRYAPAFDGNDPVLLVDRQQTVPGRRDIGCYLGVEPNRRIVLFADENTFEAFKRNPQRYAAGAFASQQ
jgi:YHS domain-containing protein/thiol-disulfide isomerase/thioredoxin